MILILCLLTCFFGNAQIVTYSPSSNIKDSNLYIFSSPYYKVELVQVNKTRGESVLQKRKSQGLVNRKSEK